MIVNISSKTQFNILLKEIDCLDLGKIRLRSSGFESSSFISNLQLDINFLASSKLKPIKGR